MLSTWLGFPDMAVNIYRVEVAEIIIMSFIVKICCCCLLAVPTTVDKAKITVSVSSLARHPCCAKRL